MNPLIKLLSQLPASGASDLHISAGMPAMVRIYGDLKPIKTPVFSAAQTREMVLGILTSEQRKAFEDELNLDFAYDMPEIGRFRANVLVQRKGIDGVFRFIPKDIPRPEEIGLTKTILDFGMLHQGLVLVTGPTRSGKTTTLAAIVQTINAQRPQHIITIEDPIEFVFPKGKALINQRQVGLHTMTTSQALRAALREDPDIIMVGEMRDLETIRLAITAAETGHLVLGTLQTQNSHKTVDRILDSFPAEQRSQVRTMLAESLRGVVAQQLIKKADGKGMVLATEILVATSSLANLIREGKTFQIPSIMQTGASHGMKKMDDAILEFLRSGLITAEAALNAAHSKKAIQDGMASKKAQKGGIRATGR